MPTDAKRQMVSELTELLAGSPSAIVTDYRGLTVAEIATVRKTLRERGITYRVIKNRLARIAAREAGLAELDPLLEGPSALAVGEVDEVVLARSFLDAVRPYRTVTVRGGLLRGRRIESAAIDRLATLPGRDVLLGQLAGGMVAPLTAMASLLSAPLRNLGYALQQVAAQKQASGAGAAPTSTADAPAPPTAPEATAASAEAATSAEPAASRAAEAAPPAASGAQAEQPAATESSAESATTEATSTEATDPTETTAPEATAPEAGTAETKTEE